MKVGARIISGFSIPILMFFVFGLWLQFVLEKTPDHLQQVKDESMAFALIAKDMELNVTQVQQYLSDISATRAMDGLADGFKEAEAHYNEFIADLAKFKQLFAAKGNPKGVENCKRILDSFEVFYANGVKMAQAYIDGGPSRGNRLMLDFDRASLELQDSLQPFIKAQLEEMDAAVERAKGDAVAARITGLVLGFFVIVVSILVTRMTALSITRPLGRMQAAINEIEEKSDFTIQTQADSNDEIGQTALAFNRLMGKFNEIILHMRASVDGIAVASQELNQSIVMATQRSHQQSEATNEAAASARTLSVSMSGISKRTGESGKLSEQGQEETRKAVAITRESMSNMGQTAETIKQSAANVSMLSESSEKISGIITAIKEIADQTNLLALNAAIEAARAGEQGRGFAVVADEVRKLSERTSSSTVEIGKLISAIQTQVEQAVKTMQAADEQVTRSVEMAGQATDALENIGLDAEQINERMKEIVNSIQECDAAVHSIADQLQRVAQMTEGNCMAASFNESTAKNLEELAANLHQIVARYKVVQTGNTLPMRASVSSISNPKPGQNQGGETELF